MGGFNVGDVNKNGLLDPGEDWKYTFNGAAQVGQYENMVVTTAAGNISNTSVTANSISHYFATVPAISIVKETNGQVALNPPGPNVFVGTTVTFTYLVSNPDTDPLHNVTVTDDNGTPGNPADDLHPRPFWRAASTSATPTKTVCSIRASHGPIRQRGLPRWASTRTWLP